MEYFQKFTDIIITSNYKILPLNIYLTLIKILFKLGAKYDNNSLSLIELILLNNTEEKYIEFVKFKAKIL